jgi:hypothetical protein
MDIILTGTIFAIAMSAGVLAQSSGDVLLIGLENIFVYQHTAFHE